MQTHGRPGGPRRGERLGEAMTLVKFLVEHGLRYEKGS